MACRDECVLIDSSIIPIQLSAHLSATVYGIAEKVRSVHCRAEQWADHIILMVHGFFRPQILSRAVSESKIGV